MKCPGCEQENPAGVKFCGQCGARLEWLCPACRASNPPENKFCHGCGAPLTGDARAATFPAPHSYTPKHLAEKILTSKSALEGERKQVTVLFADLKGSMELLADRDPEEARKLLDPVLTLMMEAVHRYEGTVNQVLGDGIMALFGAPLAHEDHAVRACYAALRMQESIKRYAEEAGRAHGVNVQIRVGLNSGEVVVRTIGSDLHMDYTAVGQTTHLAARMEQTAAPGTTLMTTETLRLVEGYVHTEARNPVRVKGLAEAIPVYELTGANLRRSRLQVAATLGLIPFVGRDNELEQLRRAMDRAVGGHGQVVSVVGEPGAGKSRLLHEFIQSGDTRGCLVLHTSSASYDKTAPYRPLIDVLRAYFQIQDSDDHLKIHEKVEGRLIVLEENLYAMRTAFLFLLDVPTDDLRWDALDPSARRKEVLEACRSLLLRESRAQPVVLAFENLQWSDSETQAFLDALVDSLPASRILLLVNYRSEYRHNWAGKTYYRQLHLEPLATEAVEALLQLVLGDDPTLVPLRRVLIERTDGNPLFLEESVRSLVETAVLVGSRGAYRAIADAKALNVPATVQAIIAARIDRLDPEDKALLQAASVIGKDVPRVVLQAVGDLPEEDLHRRLARLQSGELLYESKLFPDVEFTFKHALTHEVAYASLLTDRRRILHGTAMEAIERLSGDRKSEQIEALAHHAVRAERWPEAITYLEHAGRKAHGRSVYRQAIAYFEQALAALAHLPETREHQTRAIDLRLDLRAALYPLGEVGRSSEVLRVAEDVARAVGDSRRLAWIAIFLCENCRIAGDLPAAVAHLQDVRTGAGGEENLALRYVSHYLGITYHATGDFRRAVTMLQEAAAIPAEQLTEIRGMASGSLAGTRIVNASWLTRSLAELGAFAEGIVQGQQVVAAAEELNHAYPLVLACVGLGELHRIRGDAAQAVPLLERALTIVDEWNIGIMRGQVVSRLGGAYTVAGRAAEAVTMLGDAAAALESQPTRTRYPRVLALLAEAQLAIGVLEAAAHSAERALAEARAYRQRGDEATALQLLAAALSARAVNPALPAGYFGEAVALATELSMRPLLAHCHLGLGKLYRRKGKRQEAQEHLGTAITMYREMGMTYWLEKAEAELRQLA